MDDKYCIAFFQRLSELWNRKEFTDFEIIIDDKVLKTHKVVLASSSDYFKGMLTFNTREFNENRVILEDVNYEAMQALVDFCYTGKILVNNENVEDVFLLASRFCYPTVASLCHDYLDKRLATENSIGTFIIADLAGHSQLALRAWEYCIERFDLVVKEKEFMDINESLLLKFLQNNELDISETDLIDAVIEWVLKDERNRLESFEKAVEHIRFTTMEPVDLINLSSNDLIEKSPKFRSLVENAKHYHLLKSSEISQNHRYNLKRTQRIYAVGGWTEQYKAISSVEIYLPSEDKWVEGESMAEKRCGVGCTALGDNIYAIGGHDGNCYLKSVERYDTKRCRWFKDVPDMIFARTSVGTVALNGCIYAIGGQTPAGATNEVARYDPEINRWIECSSLQQKRLGAGVTVLNGYIYVAGGADIKSEIYDSVECYDPVSDSWAFVASMNSPRKHLGCTSHDGKIYAFGGRAHGTELDTAEVYDPETNVWSEIPKMQMKRSGVGVVSLLGQIYVVGGVSDDNHLNVVEALDLKSMESCGRTQHWSWKASMNLSRLGAGVVVHPRRKF